MQHDIWAGDKKVAVMLREKGGRGGGEDEKMRMAISMVHASNLMSWIGSLGYATGSFHCSCSTAAAG